MDDVLGAAAGLTMLLVDYDRTTDALKDSVLYTDSLKAILNPPTILVNAGFLLELEAAFRSFDLSETLMGSQYIRGDEDLFGLVKRIRQDPAGYLNRLRRLDEVDRQRDRAYIEETLTMVAFFLISHEIGHLLDDVNERSYATFLQPGEQLESRIANAVIKLCRHADEFAKYGFDLPGAERAVDENSEIRDREQELAQTIETLKINHTHWFGDEVSADNKGTEILLRTFRNISSRDPFLADQYRYVAVKGLFTTALYAWYRDLLTFGETMGIDGVPDSQALVMRMMQERRTYIQAASLFGDVHRFTLLRAVLAIEAIIRSGSDFFDRQGPKSIWWSKEQAGEQSPTEEKLKWWQKIFTWKPEAKKEERETLRAWWLAESLQRYYLLCILMDTAVKIAYMGCATGWIVEADRERGTPQLFMMNFEPINAAVQRLRSFQ